MFKALNQARGLYLRWIELQEVTTPIAKDEFEWTNTELKNAVRSIEWDLEDLEDTINILLNNIYNIFSPNYLTIQESMIVCVCFLSSFVLITGHPSTITVHSWYFIQLFNPCRKTQGIELKWQPLIKTQF